MDRGAWRGTVQGIAKSWTWLSDFHFHFFSEFPSRHCFGGRRVVVTLFPLPQWCSTFFKGIYILQFLNVMFYLHQESMLGWYFKSFIIYNYQLCLLVLSITEKDGALSLGQGPPTSGVAQPPPVPSSGYNRIHGGAWSIPQLSWKLGSKDPGHHFKETSPRNANGQQINTWKNMQPHKEIEAWASLMAQTVKNLSAMQETQV